MARLKRIFVGFAVEDEWARNLLRGHAKLGDSPIEYADFSVKLPWDANWKAQCRTRIKGCDGMIALLSSNTETASGARWEIKCAVEEGVPVLGIVAKRDDVYVPPEMPPNRTFYWDWDTIANFINSLP